MRMSKLAMMALIKTPVLIVSTKPFGTKVCTSRPFESRQNRKSSSIKASTRTAFMVDRQRYTYRSSRKFFELFSLLRCERKHTLSMTNMNAMSATWICGAVTEISGMFSRIIKRGLTRIRRRTRCSRWRILGWTSGSQRFQPLVISTHTFCSHTWPTSFVACLWIQLFCKPRVWSTGTSDASGFIYVLPTAESLEARENLATRRLLLGFWSMQVLLVAKMITTRSSSTKKKKGG